MGEVRGPEEARRLADDRDDGGQGGLVRVAGDPALAPEVDGSASPAAPGAPGRPGARSRPCPCGPASTPPSPRRIPAPATRSFGNFSKTPYWKSEVKACRTASAEVTFRKKEYFPLVYSPKRPGAVHFGSSEGWMPSGEAGLLRRRRRRGRGPDRPGACRVHWKGGTKNSGHAVAGGAHQARAPPPPGSPSESMGHRQQASARNRCRSPRSSGCRRAGAPGCRSSSSHSAIQNRVRVGNRIARSTFSMSRRCEPLGRDPWRRAAPRRRSGGRSGPRARRRGQPCGPSRPGPRACRRARAWRRVRRSRGTPCPRRRCGSSPRDRAGRAPGSAARGPAARARGRRRRRLPSRRVGGAASWDGSFAEPGRGRTRCQGFRPRRGIDGAFSTGTGLSG